MDNRSDFQFLFNGIFGAELIREMLDVGSFKSYKAGEIIMNLDQEIKFIPLLTRGAIKIMREDEAGDELLLYFIEGGNTCAMTLNCCMGKKASEIRAEVDIDASMLMIPVKYMAIWSAQYESWRNYIYNSYHNRMTELLNTIDEIAFKELDIRLLNYLKTKAELTLDKSIKNTHLEIAQDLNSSRVVISRLLKKLENKGLLKIYRNKIELIDL